MFPPKIWKMHSRFFYPASSIALNYLHPIKAYILEFRPFFMAMDHFFWSLINNGMAEKLLGPYGRVGGGVIWTLVTKLLSKSMGRPVVTTSSV